ncbi:MAG TPA: esterase-like activity of phytase family protein, partial [Thermomicrobiales bacterium]|nr:esterase-like activity of phytase family protein [Thermomicrobiales bacterium]
YDLDDGAFAPAAEYLYLAQPDQDVSDIAAISDDALLVLERGVTLIDGFSSRIFRVELDDAEDVAEIERLEESDAAPVEAELLVDVADCPSGDLETFGGFNPLLANFESMAIGPLQADGRQTLIIGSDDDFESFLVTRYLIFAVDPPRF